MSTIIAAFGSAFRSERLVYRAIEDNDRDKNFIFKHLRQDPVSNALASPALHRPFSQLASDQKVELVLKNALLAAMICEYSTLDTLNKEHKPIGTLHISEIHMYQRRATIAIQIAPEYQNKGYGFEAINWAMDWSFRWAGVHSLAIGAASYNERAIAVYKKAGFKAEGISREAIYRDRKWHDAVQLAILEHGWETLRGISDDKSSP
ncbi:acyl-CoA N-acyltransferase [Xylariaceae sp. FL1651]|nr:acyl-CoA N-acyltransferase [Xylariaceae sp. FL1651]